MSRSFRDLLKFSAPVLLSAALLSGCGSGSSGSADLGQGPSVESPPPPVTVSETFNFEAPNSFFVVGTPPTHARFSDGLAENNGAWIIPSGQTGVVEFGTPADAVKFSSKDNFTATSGGGTGQQKGMLLPRGSQKVDPPYDVPAFVRGFQKTGDWAAPPERQLLEVADNVLERSIALTTEAATTEGFKIADQTWQGFNCGADSGNPEIKLGVTYEMTCSTAALGPPAIQFKPAEDANYKFRFDATGEDKDKPKLTITKDTGDGGGGTPEPEEDSTEIRIYAVDVLKAGAQPTLLKTVKGLGKLDVDELRQGGATRITRIEIENKGTAGDVGVEDFAWTANPRFALAPVSVDIFYNRPEGVAGTRIAVGGQSPQNCVATTSGVGCVVRDVQVPPFANTNMVVTNTDGSSETILFNSDGEDVFATSGAPVARSGAPGQEGKPLPALPRDAKEVILFYKRDDNNYTGWGLHLFPLDPPGDAWTKFATPGEFPFEGIDPQWGAYFRIALPGSESPRYSNNPATIDTFPAALGFIIHKGDTKDPGPDQVIRIAETGNIVYVTSGVNEVGTVPPGGSTVARISRAVVHWIDRSTLVAAETPPEGAVSGALYYSPDGSIQAGLQGITGNFEKIPLTPTANPNPDNQRHLRNKPAFALPQSAVARARDLARGQLVVVPLDADGKEIDGTNVQLAGALDDLYAAAAKGQPLGVTYASGVPSLAVWAPTALTDPGVSVNVYDAAGALLETKPMTLDPDSGIWKVTGTAAWDRKFYKIVVKVFSYATNSFVTNEVTDPYSVSLATDSVRSQFVNLADTDLKPAGWDGLALAPLAAPEDLSIYELHVRDFSIADSSVPAADRGKFTAFDIPGTAGRNHLQQLASAGLTAVHILPPFDIATVRENPADQVNIDDPVAALCAKNPAAASLCVSDAGKTIRQAMQDAVATNQLDRPQQIVEWIRDYDGFNWGYDPLHFGVPDGSYSTDPNGPKRILEFRRMVKGLNELGLRTIIDVVYNHTNASGQNSRSVLDRVVPGYYHRRDEVTGNVLTDGCCPNTAAEFKMMEKLMIDTGVTWVRDYKVAGFRFDLMSFHPLDAMTRFQDAVKAVEPSVYVYGEGWNFGAIENDKRFLAARQANMGGTGIGSFSDRIRDPIRGGGPFDSGSAHVKNQGLISGWFYAPNAENSGSNDERLALITDSDNIRAWLAGGLASFRFENAAGNVVTGADIDYRGQKSGYTKDPQEAINYIAKHDNETLWDISAYKHATGTPLAERIRADTVGMSLMLLGQGIPFWQAGTEILRSKSMDRNSFDSGDWFNEIDWTLATGKWNQGLPRQSENSGNVDQVKTLILDVTAAPDAAARATALANFKEFLQIRKSSPLFRLRNQAQIDQRLKYFNTGPFQIPGIVAMSIDGCTEPGFTPAEGALMAIFNASDDPRTLSLFTNETWTLHPVQAASVDPVVRTARHDANGFFVPARTTAVFRRASQTSCAPFSRDIFVRGIGADWTASPANQLQFQGGTIYEVTKTLAAGQDPEGFKIADADWTSGTDCGAEKPVVFGEPLTLACQSPGNGNINMFVDSPGNYVFRLDAASTTNPALTVRKAPAFPRAIYVRGINEDWGATATTLMQQDPASNVYRVVLNAPAGPDNVGFKIADADWTSGTDCGSDTPVTLGQPLTLACASPGNGNIGITFPSAGTYLFALDATNPAAPQLTVEKTPFNADLYVRGVGTDWTDSATNRMTYLGGGLYRARRAATAGVDPDGGFKIASADWSTADCGSSSALTIGQPLALVCNAAGNGNIAVTWPATGTYTFSLNATNAATPQLTVTGP